MMTEIKRFPAEPVWCLETAERAIAEMLQVRSVWEKLTQDERASDEQKAHAKKLVKQLNQFVELIEMRHDEERMNDVAMEWMWGQCRLLNIHAESLANGLERADLAGSVAVANLQASQTFGRIVPSDLLTTYTPVMKLYKAALAMETVYNAKEFNAAKAFLNEALRACQEQMVVRAKNAAATLAARAQYCSNNLRIDDMPMVAESDDGVWVSAWVRMPSRKAPAD